MKNQNILSKRDLLAQRYADIYQNIPDWQSQGEQLKSILFRIHPQSSLLNSFSQIAQEHNIQNIEQITESIWRIPIEYKNIISDKINKDGTEGIIFNASSLIPTLLMPIEANTQTLDICAAPGIKSANILFNHIEAGNNTELTSAEKDRKRSYKMEDLFHKLNLNVNTVTIDSRFLKMDTVYDHVLCDVPCSAEGEMIRNNNYNLWSSKLINSYTNTQKALLAKAISLVKSGGTIVYSTCTLAPEENEEVVNWALKRFDIEILPIRIPPLGIQAPTIISGIPTWGIHDYDPSIQNTIRIVPNNHYEGFFVALIRKH